MKTTLTIQESAELIKRGVSADKASAAVIYLNYADEEVEPYKIFKREGDGVLLTRLRNGAVIGVESKIVLKDSDSNYHVPIFTLADLFAILPKGIIYNGLSCKLRITSWYDEPYFAGYENQVGKYVMGNPYDAPFSAEELIDVIFQLLCWTIDNHHVKLD